MQPILVLDKKLLHTTQLDTETNIVGEFLQK